MMLTLSLYHHLHLCVPQLSLTEKMSPHKSFSILMCSSEIWVLNYFFFLFRWMDGGFLDLNGESMEADVDEFSREIFKTLKFFQTKQKKELQEKRKAARKRSLMDEKPEEEPKENPTIAMCTTVMEQIKVFKVYTFLMAFKYYTSLSVSCCILYTLSDPSSDLKTLCISVVQLHINRLWSVTNQLFLWERLMRKP